MHFSTLLCCILVVCILTLRTNVKSCTIVVKCSERKGEVVSNAIFKLQRTFTFISSLNWASVLTQAYTESLAGGDNRQKGARETACELLGLVSKMIEETPARRAGFTASASALPSPHRVTPFCTSVHTAQCPNGEPVLSDYNTQLVGQYSCTTIPHQRGIVAIHVQGWGATVLYC